MISFSYSIIMPIPVQHQKAEIWGNFTIWTVILIETASTQQLLAIV